MQVIHIKEQVNAEGGSGRVIRMPKRIRLQSIIKRRNEMEKKSVVINERMESDEIINFLEDLVESLRAGTVCIQHGDDLVTLKPGCHVGLELEAAVKKGKEKLSLEMSWLALEEEEKKEFRILSSEPVLEEEVDEDEEDDEEEEGEEEEEKTIRKSSKNKDKDKKDKKKKKSRK